MKTLDFAVILALAIMIAIFAILTSGCTTKRTYYPPDDKHTLEERLESEEKGFNPGWSTGKKFIIGKNEL